MPPPPLLLLLPLLLLGSTILAPPPRAQAQQGIHCPAGGDQVHNCTVEGYLGMWGDRSVCRVREVVYPRTEAGLVRAVARAARHRSKVKVVSVSMHASPKLVCPGGGGAPPAGDWGTLISTRDYDATVRVDTARGTVTAAAGARLYALLDACAAAGVALPNVPVWGGLTVAGLMATGAHGTSHWRRSRQVHDRVVGVRLVVPASAADGYAKVLKLGRDRNGTTSGGHHGHHHGRGKRKYAEESVEEAEVLDAARISLGVLGVVSEVTLAVEPLFKRDYARTRTSDADLGARTVALARASEFGDVHWYPATREAVYLRSDRVPLATPGTATLPDGALQPVPAAAVPTLRAVQDAAILPPGNRTLLCAAAAARLNLTLPPPGTTTVVGYAHQLSTSAACLLNHPTPDSICFFQSPSVLMQETSLAVPLRHFPAFVRDVQALRDARPAGLCGLGFYYGFWLRFIAGGSRALLGEQEDAVDVNALYYRARAPGTPRLDEDVLEEVEQVALLKYGAKAHWGKSNRYVSFQGQAAKFGDRVRRFLAVRARLDPHGIFSSPWTDGVLGVSGAEVVVYRPVCALEGLCICQEDAHCAPEQGYFCRRGLVYKKARVCRHKDVHVG